MRIRSKRPRSAYVAISYVYDRTADRKFVQTIAEGKAITGDLGGKASTREYTEAIIGKLRA